MTAGADLPEPPPRAALGGWWRRVLAVLADLLLAVVLLSPVLGLAALASAVSTGLGLLLLALAAVGHLAIAGWQLVRQGRTGATYGKELLGLRLVSERSGRPLGARRSVWRAFVHVIDTVPYFIGYLLPLVDGKRQTFTDQAMRTLVLRVPRRRLPVRVAALALPLAALLVTGSLVVAAESAPGLDALVEREPTTSRPPAAAPRPTGPLPVEDTAGRIAPPAPGYTVVPDAVSGLGPLDVRQAAALGTGDEQEARREERELRALGLLGAFGRRFRSGDLSCSVLAYRFGSPAGAARFQRSLPSAVVPVQASAVPGAIVFAAGDQGRSALTGIFTVGAYSYEVTLARDRGPVDGAALEALLVRQHQHALRTG